MASKYARRMVIPPDFAETLKGFTREVLRSLPSDLEGADAEQWIYEFGANYFSRRADDEPAPGFLQLDNLTSEELEAKLIDIFLDADRDGSGTLDSREFKSVFKRFADELGFPPSDIRAIMAEADENDDGCIEYQEFARAAGQVIQTLLAKTTYESVKRSREESAVEQSKGYLLHSLTKEEFKAVLDSMFRTADTDGSGFLSRAEFSRALRESGLGLTRREINVLLFEVDADADNMVSYEEFLPLCFNLLVEIVAQQFEASSMPRDERDLKEFFVDVFSSADTEGTGRLPVSDLAHLLERADLGLSAIQRSAILSEAIVDDDGTVEYARFAGDAAIIIAAIIDLQVNASRAAAVVASRADNTVLDGMTQEAFTEALVACLAKGDTTGSGRVYVTDAVASLVADVGLTEKQANGVVLYAGQDAEGNVSITDVAAGAFAVLRAIAENSKLAAGEL